MKLDNRLWILVASVLTVALLAGGWFIGVQPQLALAAEAGTQRDAANVTNDATRAQIQALSAEQAELTSLQDELATLQRSVPAGVDGSAFIAEINRIADETGASLQGVTLASPRAYAPTAAPADDAAAESAAAEEAPAEDEAAEAAPVPAGPAAGPAPFADALVTTDNLVIVDVTIEAQGGNDQLLAFLDRVQSADRLLLATAVRKSSNAGGEGDDASAGGYGLTITASIYVVKSSATAALAQSMQG